MSYILDALHKAERQTPKGGLSPLDDLQELDDDESSSVWKWGIGVGFLVVVVAAVFFWGRMSGTDVKSTASTVQVSPPVKPIPSSVPGSVPSPPDTPLTPTAAPAAIPAAQVAVSAPLAPVVPKVVVPTPAAVPVVELPTPEIPPVAKISTQPKPAPASVVPPPMTDSKDSSLPWEDEAPKLLSLKYEFRSQIRPIEVNVKVYSSEPSKRFVMLNMRKYREGDVTKEGPVVEQIGPNSILFSYQGEAFQIAHP